MDFQFHPEAETELNISVEYYENIEPGLGVDFASEIYQAIHRAISFPEAWAILRGNVRRVLVGRFPYGVLYVTENDHLTVLAVMHLNKKPGYWKNRLD
ncbi:MAG: type II toxin-antitoxin system RelE/ParE family toxin [bacterium]